MEGGEGMVFRARWKRRVPRRVPRSGQCDGPYDPQILFAGLVGKVIIRRICAEAAVGRGNVHQSRAWIKRHRRPVVSAARTRRQHHGVAAVVRYVVYDRPARRFVQALRPGDLHQRLAGNELPRHAIQHVVEAVFVRLHDHLARPSFDGEVGQHQLLDAVVVPGIAGDHLEVPFQFARLGFHRQHGADIKLSLPLDCRISSATARRCPCRRKPNLLPDRTRSVPHRAAAAQLPRIAVQFRRLFSAPDSRTASMDRQARYKTSMRNVRYSHRRPRRIRAPDTPIRSRRQ